MIAITFAVGIRCLDPAVPHGRLCLLLAQKSQTHISGCLDRASDWRDTTNAFTGSSAITVLNFTCAFLVQENIYLSPKKWSSTLIRSGNMPRHRVFAIKPLSRHRD
jgi:hypothetical protein